MIAQAEWRISRPDLEILVDALEVRFLKLAECRVGAGWRLSVDRCEASGIHYIVGGTGRMIVGAHPPFDLQPDVLVILPRGGGFVVEGPGPHLGADEENVVHVRWPKSAPGTLRFSAGYTEPQLTMVCGYFSAKFGASIDLFNTLRAPLVERFDESDHMQHRLKTALAEMIAGDIGMEAMTTSALKQVLLMLLRKSLISIPVWDGRFSMFSDPQMSHAFAQMVARPGGPHSVQSLAQLVGLSRSAFMSRFTGVIGTSPMAVLRGLRMRQAAALLMGDRLSIEQISRIVGYASRSSFFRAFRKVYGIEPSEYRAANHRRGQNEIHEASQTEASS